MAFSRPLMGLIEAIRDATVKDIQLQQLRSSILSTPAAYPHHAEQDGLLLVHGRILVPNETALRTLLLREFHSSTIGGHAGITRTFRRLAANFHWTGMRREVRRFVSECQVFQRMKSDSLTPAGLLQPLPIPNQVFEDISIDFIVGLPKSNGKEAICVVVDRLTKYAHFFSLPRQFDSELVARILVQGVIKLHGIPRSIVSDRDRIFLSDMWTELARLQGTELCFSSAYHPQTDGQTEALNRCLEMYLRCMAGDDPGKWEQFLSWAEYWYNTAYQSSAGMNPFRALYGRDPPTIMNYLEGNLQQAQQRMKTQADRHRRELQLEVSLRLHREQKLGPRYFGPYRVLQKVGQVAYKLDLPASTHIHSVFHVSQLKPCKGHSDRQITPLPLLQEDLTSDTATANLADKVVLPGGGTVMHAPVTAMPEKNEETQEPRRSSRERKTPNCPVHYQAVPRQNLKIVLIPWYLLKFPTMAVEGSKKSQASASLPPRKINLQKFAESRAAELESLHSTVSARLNNDFRSRRNKRRRTTSFDSQASKKRNRKRQRLIKVDKGTVSGLETEEKKNEPPIPRRVRRRMELKKNPESGFVTSGDGTKRLRTHVWHAKRFTMAKRWGFYLPLGLHGRGRGSRAVLRWFKQGVLLHDASYNIAVQLEGPEDSLVAILEMVLVPSTSVKSDGVSGSVLSGVTYGIAMLHHVGAPYSQPIAPVTYMWHPHRQSKEDDNNNCYRSCFCQLWVWIHASAFSEGYDALKCACQKLMIDRGITINCFSREGQLAKLELIGCKAFQLLQKIVHPVSCIADNSWQLQKCSVEKDSDDFQKEKSFTLENEEHTPSHAILSFTINDPRLLSAKEIADFHEPDSIIDMQEVGASDRDNLTGNLDKNTGLGSLSCPKPEGNEILSDKNLWDASSRIDPPEEESELCMEKHQQRMDFFCLDDPKSGPPRTSNKVQRSRSCPILLLKDNSKDSPIRWSVILPISWARVFWNCLVSKGAHVIGLREKHWIAGEIGLPCFPSDFPECRSYLFLNEIEATASREKAERRPPAVRPFRIPIPSPWNVIHTAFGKLTTRGEHLLLFPQLQNRNSSLVKVMKDKNMMEKGQNGIAQISYSHRLCFVRVHLHAYKEGVFEEGAVICAPSLADISMWTSSTTSIEGGLEMPNSAVGSYFKEQPSGKWELQEPDDPASIEYHRWPVGFVTTGFVRGSKKPTAVAYCEAVLLACLREEQWKEMTAKRRRKEIYVLVRNLRSSAYRLALATIVLEQQEEDLRFL
ncbi:hypothetical protein GQ457_06G031370 [Hibiscus cannabinus]